jgi:hypothetical protein
VQKFLVLLLKLFVPFEFWSFGIVSDFEFRASDLVAATPRGLPKTGANFTRNRQTLGARKYASPVERREPAERPEHATGALIIHRFFTA